MTASTVGRVGLGGGDAMARTERDASPRGHDPQPAQPAFALTDGL